MQKTLTRTGATLTAEGIRASVIYDNPDAATSYVLYKKIQKIFYEWLKGTKIEDVQKASPHRKPKTIDSAIFLLDSRLDAAKKQKLIKVLEVIEDGDIIRGWRLLIN